MVIAIISISITAYDFLEDNFQILLFKQYDECNIFLMSKFNYTHLLISINCLK